MKVFMLRNVDTGAYYRRGCYWVSQPCATMWTSRKGPYSARGAVTKHHQLLNTPPAPPTEIVEMSVIDELDMDLVVFALRGIAMQQDEMGGDGADFRDLAERLV